MKNIFLSIFMMGLLTHAFAEPKILIAYFSWSGNTENAAELIKKELGEKADIFKIEPEKPYSDDYNTVLKEAQRDQHNKARPALKGNVKLEKYDTIILGYPNWWASIPAPIATFLENGNFNDKEILPFCSHGGGRFGQSISAISKLAPKAKIKKGLSIHYSGGSELKNDVREWLEKNRLK